MEAKCPWCGDKISITAGSTKFCPSCRMPIMVKILRGPGGKFIFKVVQDRRPSKARR